MKPIEHLIQAAREHVADLPDTSKGRTQRGLIESAVEAIEADAKVLEATLFVWYLSTSDEMLQVEIADLLAKRLGEDWHAQMKARAR